MRTRPSLLKFFKSHPLSVLSALAVHGVIIASTLYLTQDQFKRNNLPTEELTSYKATSEKPIGEKKSTNTVKIIQAEVIDSLELAKKVAELKSIELEKRKIQLDRLQNIQKQQRKLTLAEKRLNKEHKKLNQKRLKEEKKLKKLRQQQSKIKQQRERATLELKKQELATKKAKEKLSDIHKKQAETKKILKQLEQQNERTKQANSKLIKKTLEEQRRLENLRSKEELKIAKAAKKHRTLALETQEKEKRLQDLTIQEKKQVQDIHQRLNKLASIQQTELSKLRVQYITRIRQRVRSNWFEPPNSNSNWTCTVNVEQTPRGKIKAVRTNSCSKGATQIFRDSIIRAVRRSDPLPQAPDAKVFESIISFQFIP